MTTLKQRHFLLCYLFFAGMLLTSCSGHDYRDVIPPDCRSVVSIDFASVASKSGIDATQMGEKVKSLLLRTVSSGDVHAALQRMGNVQIKTGIDFGSRIYAFPFGNDYIGFLAKVSDEDDMEDFFDAMQKQNVCSKTEKSGGYHWTTFSNGWMAAFDDEQLFIAGPGMDALLLRRAMMTRLKADDGVTSTPLFDEMEQQKGEITFVVSPALLPSMLQTPISMALPDKVDMSAVLLPGSLSFESDKVNINMSLWSDNPTLAKACEAIDDSRLLINPATLSRVPAGVVSCFVSHFMGDPLLKSMRRDKGLRSMLMTANFGVDADLMLRSIKGDALLTVKSMDAAWKPNYTMYAQLANADFLRNAPYWKKSAARQQGMSLTSYTPSDFFFHTSDFNIYFGVANQWLYVSSDPQRGQKVQPAAPSTAMARYGKAAAGNHLFGFVDFDLLMNQPCMKGKGAVTAGLFGMLHDNYSGAVISSRNGRDINVVLQQRHNGNMLKQLFR